MFCKSWGRSKYGDTPLAENMAIWYDWLRYEYECFGSGEYASHDPH